MAVTAFALPATLAIKKIAQVVFGIVVWDFKSAFLKILDCVLNGHQLITVIPIIKTEHLSQFFYKDTVNRTNSVFGTTAAKSWRTCSSDCKWKK